MLKRLLASVVVLAGLASQAQAFEISAESAILVDMTTDTVLFEKAPRAPTYPSSMTKLMTAYLLFEQLADGLISLEDTLPVSERAWRMGGSKMFVEVATNVSIEDLIRGIVVQSGNDASIVVAEGLAGSEDAFARMMTEKARELGMHATTYRNASGWPDDGHVTTVEDIAILTRRTIEDFPQYYHYYAETSFSFSEIQQSNRNPLLYTAVGADGLKTGYTRDAGYGLAASAVRDGRRLILAVNGFDGSRTRARQSEAILQWGFREFGLYKLFEAGEAVGDAEVWLGAADTVPLVVADEVQVTLSHAARGDLAVRIVYDGPVPAPLDAGTRVATLVVELPGGGTIERPLLAGADVERMSFFLRLGTRARPHDFRRGRRPLTGGRFITVEGGEGGRQDDAGSPSGGAAPPKGAVRGGPGLRRCHDARTGRHAGGGSHQECPG